MKPTKKTCFTSPFKNLLRSKK